VRKLAVILAVTACGGGKPATATSTENEAPPADPVCDELVVIAKCLARDEEEYRLAEEAEERFRRDLAEPGTREETVRGCAQALPRAREEASTMGCAPVATGDPTCDEVVALSFCVGRYDPEARVAAIEAAEAYRDALAGPARDATVAECAAALPARREAANAVTWCAP
jgi:hypothetical protein